MAVDFISAKIPPWKAIQTRLKIKQKLKGPARVNLDKIGERKLGPGLYQFKEMKKGGNTFSILPRFSPNERLKLMVPTVDRVLTERKRVKSSIGNFKGHTDEYRNRLKSCDVVGKTGKNLLKLKTEERLEKIKRKNQKIEKWLTQRHFVNTQKTWFMFFCVSGIVKILNVRLELKNLLRYHSTFLYQITKCIGKISIKLKQNRQKKIFKKIGDMALPYFYNHIQKTTRDFRDQIIYFTELNLTKKIIKKICLYRRLKIKTLEEGLRKIISQYKSNKEKLLKIWNEIQRKYHKNSNKKIIPKDQSEKIIKKYLFGKLKEHYFSQTEHRVSVKRYKKSLAKTYYTRSQEAINKQRLSFIFTSLPAFRLFNQDDLIRLYLEEEQKTTINII